MTYNTTAIAISHLSRSSAAPRWRRQRSRRRTDPGELPTGRTDICLSPGNLEEYTDLVPPERGDEFGRVGWGRFGPFFALRAVRAHCYKDSTRERTQAGAGAIRSS